MNTNVSVTSLSNPRIRSQPPWVTYFPGEARRSACEISCVHTAPKLPHSNKTRLSTPPVPSKLCHCNAEKKHKYLKAHMISSFYPLYSIRDTVPKRDITNHHYISDSKSIHETDQNKTACNFKQIIQLTQIYCPIYGHLVPCAGTWSKSSRLHFMHRAPNACHPPSPHEKHQTIVRSGKNYAESVYRLSFFQE